MSLRVLFFFCQNNVVAVRGKRLNCFLVISFMLRVSKNDFLLDFSGLEQI